MNATHVRAHYRLFFFLFSNIWMMSMCEEISFVPFWNFISLETCPFSIFNLKIPFFSPFIYLYKFLAPKKCHPSLKWSLKFNRSAAIYYAHTNYEHQILLKKMYDIINIDEIRFKMCTLSLLLLLLLLILLFDFFFADCHCNFYCTLIFLLLLLLL